MKEDKYKDELATFLKQKDFAVKARQSRVTNMLDNEVLYNGNTKRTLLTRSNLHVPKLFEGVQSYNSRMGSTPDHDYDTKPEGDENASDIMKAVLSYDKAKSNFDSLFHNSKTECGIYGRAIIKLIGRDDGARFKLIDTLSFLIDPLATNTDDAFYCGEQFIYKTISEIEDDASDMSYDEDQIKRLKSLKLASDSVLVASDQEESRRNYRQAQLGLSNVTKTGKDSVELNEWWTHIDGKLKVMTVADDIVVLRCREIKDLGYREFPYVSYGAYERGITFWVPGVADIYRDGNLAANVILNQQIDNNTYRNFGMKFVDSRSGLKQTSIVPRPLGITPVNVPEGQSIQTMVLPDTPPSIGESMQMFNTIVQTIDTASGLGMPLVSGKKMSATQQASLQARIDMSTNAMRQNINNAMTRLYQKYSDWIQDNLTVPQKVKFFGFKQDTLENVTKKNFEGVEFIAHAIPSESSADNKAIKQKAVIETYQLFKDDPRVPGQLALRKKVAKEMGGDPEFLTALFENDEEENNKMAQGAPQIPGQQVNTGAPGMMGAPQGGQPPAPGTPAIAQTQQAAQAVAPNQR